MRQRDVVGAIRAPGQIPADGLMPGLRCLYATLEVLQITLHPRAPDPSHPTPKEPLTQHGARPELVRPHHAGVLVVDRSQIKLTDRVLNEPCLGACVSELALIQKVTSNDASRLVDGQAQYSCLPNNVGGIVDDLLVYRFSENSYMLVVNASNIEKIGTGSISMLKEM